MSLYSYMLTVLGIIFWIFRIIVTATYTTGASFPILPLQATWEIILLFATVPCMVLVLKRNIIGAALYVAVYVSYFGTALYNSINHISDSLNVNGDIDLIMATIGIVIPVLTFIDILLNKNRKTFSKAESETDWYYKNKDYDRQLDERADKNQYKIK